MAQFAIMTQTGRNKEAAALAANTALSIAEIAWGDGDRIPGGNETSLQNEQGRKAVQGRGTVADALNTAFFDILLDVDEGPFIIRETGLFDDAGDLIAIAHYDPPVNKPKDTVSALLRMHVLFSDLQNLVLRVQGTDAYVAAERTLTAGAGLKGGGDLSADRSFAVDFATRAVALTGTSTDKVISPLRAAQMIKAVTPPTVTILTSGANAIYVAPQGCKTIHVKGVGGGAGGEAPATHPGFPILLGLPGGGGAGFEAWLTPTPLQEFTYTVGAGGSPGGLSDFQSPVFGGSGGTTRFGEMHANGGRNTSSGSTATASGGHINYRGSPGQRVNYSSHDGREFLHVPGGSIFGPSDSVSAWGDGQHATVPGTGGAGGAAGVGGPVFPCGGADGIIVITEFY